MSFRIMPIAPGATIALSQDIVQDGITCWDRNHPPRLIKHPNRRITRIKDREDKRRRRIFDN